MKRFTLFVLAVVVSFAPRLALSQSSATCPADVPVLRNAVLIRISYDRIRSDFGLTAVDTTHLRALTDPGDSTACHQFRTAADYSPGWITTAMTWSYYTADGFYFVAGTPTQVGAGHGILFIFDSAFNRKAAILL